MKHSTRSAQSLAGFVVAMAIVFAAAVLLRSCDPRRGPAEDDRDYTPAGLR